MVVAVIVVAVVIDDVDVVATEGHWVESVAGLVNRTS